MISGALSSPFASACCPSLFLIMFASHAGGASTGSAPSSPVAGGSPFFAISGRPLVPAASVSPLFAVSGGPLSTISSHSLSFVRGDPSTTISGSGLLSSVPNASFRALFMPSSSSCACLFYLLSLPLFYSSLSSSPTSLAGNPTRFTRKRLFDKAFITQKPIALTQQEEELDLSFGQ